MPSSDHRTSSRRTPCGVHSIVHDLMSCDCEVFLFDFFFFFFFSSNYMTNWLSTWPITRRILKPVWFPNTHRHTMTSYQQMIPQVMFTHTHLRD